MFLLLHTYVYLCASMCIKECALLSILTEHMLYL